MLDKVFLHRSLVRKSYAWFTVAAVLAVLTPSYLAHKVGTFTSLPLPFVVALYAAVPVSIAVGLMYRRRAAAVAGETRWGSGA